MQKEIKKWLEEYAKQVEETEETPLHCRIGDYKGQYYQGDDKFTKIQGGLFLTTHQGNLFTVYTEHQVTDCFDIFDSESEIVIDENFFPYISNGYKISIKQINTDIKMLTNHFLEYGGAWVQNDGDYGCVSIAEQELELVKRIASRYPFEYQYNPSEFDKNPSDFDEDWSDIKFDNDDFNNNNVNEENYIKVDAVAFDFKDQLIEMLSQLKKELEWFPPRFRYEFTEVICSCEQDAKSVRKNAEYFAETIEEELTKEEKEEMFITIGE